MLNELILEQFNFVPTKLILLVNFLENSDSGVVLRGAPEVLHKIS